MKQTWGRTILCGVLALGLGWASSAVALDSSWSTNMIFNVNYDWNNAAFWSGGVPGSGDNAWLTNTPGASGRIITNGLASTTIDNLIFSNSTSNVRVILQWSNQTFTVANTGTIGRLATLNLLTNVTATFGNLVLENLGATPSSVNNGSITVGIGSRLQVNGTGTLSAGVLNIGVTASGSALSTAVFNNLVMSNSASINFAASGLAGRGPDALIVTGSFQNASGNAIIGAADGNGMSLFFSNIATVVNNGYLTNNFGTYTAAGLNIIATGSASDNRTNYFVNKGTNVFGFVSGIANPANGTVWTNQLTMNLVNEGWFAVSNAMKTSGANLPTTNLVLLSGSVAATNTATGTISLYSTNRTSGSPVVIDFRVTSGFVNAGTLVAGGESAASVTATQLFTVLSGGTFSNAGWVVSPALTAARLYTFAVRADRAVNTGTNLVSGGTLTYQSSTGGAGILENYGLLKVDGTLAVNTLTNGIGGALQGIGTVRALTISEGLVNPGNSVGTLTNSGNFILTSTAIAKTEINSTGADQLYVVGALTLTGSLDVVLLDAFTPTGTEVYTNMAATAGISGVANSFTNVFLSGGNYLVNAYSNGVVAGTFQVSVIDTLGTDYLVLNNFVVIPEPSAVVLVGVGILGAVLLRRRRTGVRH